LEQIMENWYAIRVRSNFEKVVQECLRQHDLEEFLPVYLKKSRWSDRVKTIERPLFPGYVFGRFNPANRLPVLKMPGVVNILGNSAGPMAVDDEELHAIRRTVESGHTLIPWPYLAAGDSVIVEGGALAGLEGIFVRAKDICRVVVSLNLLQRSIAVELDRESVRPAKTAPCYAGKASDSLYRTVA
jgi:transcription antitermination factor NusG